MDLPFQDHRLSVGHPLAGSITTGPTGPLASSADGGRSSIRSRKQRRAGPVAGVPDSRGNPSDEPLKRGPGGDNMSDHTRDRDEPSRRYDRNGDSTTGHGTTTDGGTDPVSRGPTGRPNGTVGIPIDPSSNPGGSARTSARRADDAVDSPDSQLRELLAAASTRNGRSRVSYSGGGIDLPGHESVLRSSVLTGGDRSWENGGKDVVAIPAYNEEGTITAVIEEAREYADEVLVVDDGSDDDTANRANEAGAMVLRHDYNQGYGAALKTAFEEATRWDATSLVTIDADGQHDPSDIPTLRETLATHDADVVIGSRFIGETGTDISPLRRFGLAMINVLTNVSLGYVHPHNRIKDTQSGFRAYSGRAIRSLGGDRALDTQMGASTDILYHARKCGYSIEEVGTDISYAVENPSSQSALTHGTALTTNITKTVMYQHPILSLAVPGFASIIVGLWFGIQLVGNAIGGGIMSAAPFVLAVAFGWAGFFASLIAAMIFVVTTHGN